MFSFSSRSHPSTSGTDAARACGTRPSGLLPLFVMLLAGAASGNDLVAQSTPAGRAIPVSHRDLATWRVEVERLEQRRDLWIFIADANPLVYDYGLTGARLADDRQTADDIRKLLAGSATVAQEAKAQALIAEGTPLGDYTQFAGKVLSLGGTIFDAVVSTDDSDRSKTTRQLLDSARAIVQRAAASAELEAIIRDKVVAEMTHDVYWRALNDAQRGQLSALHTLVAEALPTVVRWYRDVRAAQPGRYVKYDFPADGSYLVELTITSRLGDLHRPNRWVGEGVDVIELRPAFRPITITFGMGGVFGMRVNSSLQKVSAATTPDTFTVVQDTVRKFSFLPATFLNLQRPFPGTQNATIGVTLGLGIKGDEASKIEQATDLLFAVTVGYEYFRLSFGYASTSEITSVVGVGADGLSTNPNALAQVNLDRKWRPVLALHVSRQ